MTLQFFTNYSPPTAIDTMFRLKQFLVACNWTVMFSSDGVANSGPSDFLTQSGTGPFGFNNFSYFVIQQPGSTRQFCFQVHNDVNWRIKYSIGGFNTPGVNPLIDTPAGATGDDNIIWGSGTDTGPNFRSLFKSDNTYKLQIGADDAGQGFYFFCYSSEKLPITSGIVFDPLLAGSYAVGDTEPYVIYVTGNSTSGFGFQELGSLLGSCPSCWMGTGTPNVIFNKITALSTIHDSASGTPATIAPGGVGSNPYTFQDQFFPIIYGRAAYTIIHPPPPFTTIPNTFHIEGPGSNVVTWNSASGPTLDTYMAIGDNIVFNTDPGTTYVVGTFFGNLRGFNMTGNFTGPNVPGNLDATIKDYAGIDPHNPPVYPPPAAGYKGISSMMQWIGTTRGTVGILSINTTGDRIIVNQIVLPWNDSTVIV